jgi:hypothetical protein
MPRFAPACRAVPWLALALLAGCDAFSGLPRGPDPAVQRIPVAPRDLPQGSGYAGAGGIVPSNYRPPLGGAVRDEAAVSEACRRDIDRVISTRDRGQLMREDEAGNRQGSDAMAYSPSSLRMQMDQMGRTYERDRLVKQCIERNNRAAASPAAPSPTPAR